MMAGFAVKMRKGITSGSDLLMTLLGGRILITSESIEVSDNFGVH